MEAGEIIAGEFEFVRRLGAGGQGEVWLAREIPLDRHVALKFFPRAEPATTDRIIAEARKLARVTHPNVVTIHRVSSHPRLPWIAMEYVQGSPLHEIRDRSVRAVAHYGAQIAGGLATVHDAGVLHLDVKPSNVLVTDDGVAKLADFGVARDVHALETLSGDGRIHGTPGYLSPEAAETNDVSWSADVFSLGATLYHVLEGTTPYGVGDDRTLLNRTQTRPIDPPTRCGEITTLVRRMLSTSPRARPTLERVRADLAAVAGDPEAGRGGRIRAGTTRPAMFAAAGLAAGVALIAGWSLLDLPVPGFPVTPAGATPTATAAPMTDVAPAGTGQPGSMGDEATADPCALLDVSTLSAFGDAELDTDADIPNRCDVVVTEPSGAQIDVQLKMWVDERHTGDAVRRGVIDVLRTTEDMPRQCETDLFLPSRDHLIALDAEQVTGDVADLCAVADAAVEHAVSVLNAGEVPRRPLVPMPGSLQTINACRVIEERALDLFLDGEESDERVRGFASWDCTWYKDDDRSLRVLVTRHEPLSASDGHRVVLGGREAYVEDDSWGPETCVVSIVHDKHPDADGGTGFTDDLVRVVFSDAGLPLEQRCNTAVPLARAVAEALPVPAAS